MARAKFFQLILCCFLIAAASSAPGSGRIFERISSASAKTLCPRQFAELSSRRSASSQMEFLVEQRPLSNHTRELELSQLLSELQLLIRQHRLSFNVTETNRRLPWSLVAAPEPRPRLCQPIYELDVGGLTRPRLPTFLLGVACPDGCREVRREVAVYRQLCDSTDTVFYRSAASVAVDCSPESDTAWW